MAAFRAVLIAGLILFVAATPLMVPSLGGPSAGSLTAYAARPLGVGAGDTAMANDNGHRHGENPGKTGKNENNNNNNNNNNGNNNNNNNKNNNGNNNNNNNSNGNGNGNGNDNNGNGNGNGNGNDNNRNGNGNGNGNDNRGGFLGTGGGGNNSRTGTTKCFDVQEVGLIQRAIGDGDVTVSVPPDAGFSAITRLSLHSVAPSTVPAPPSGSTLVDSLVWTIDAQNGCNGPAIVSLPGMVNLGVTYRVPADKSKVRIMYLQGGTWTEVTTVPDPVPSNPYVSASIGNGGTYALMQRP